jgi:hypothetical protein
MKKGRPSQEPRIAAAEARIKALEEIVSAIQRQIAAFNDSFNNGNIPRPAYESQFKIWPGANPNTNNAS